MGRMKWDRVKKETRSRENGWEPARANSRPREVWPQALRRNRTPSRCASCGSRVDEKQGWSYKQRTFHPQCLTTWNFRPGSQR